MINTANAVGLVDIANVRVDKSLPKDARILDYIRQMNYSPNHYICNGYEVISRHPKNGPKIEELLKTLIT